MNIQTDYSAEAMLQFLKQAGMEGLINPAAARARRNAVEQLSVELTDIERADLRRLNVAELAGRFHKLEGSSIRSEALSLYAERFQMALSDFIAWTDDPMHFKSVGSERRRAIPRGQLDPDQEMAERIKLESAREHADLIPIPVRGEMTVYIANLPCDLSPAEAERIVRVIRAYAREEGPQS
jgi:hypothetical protein